MEKAMRYIVVAILVVFLESYSYSAEWQLAWSDEFDYTGLPDSMKWNYEVGFVRNAEMQYYTKDDLNNARVENGMLIIEGRKQQIPNPKYNPNLDSWMAKREFAQYTSASITTRGRESWTYGRIEVRAKLPRGKGTWPAIWTLGDNIYKVKWPKCGEIDIMEQVGKDPDWIYGTVHYSADDKHISSGGKIRAVDPVADFHIYAINWYDDHIDFFFDSTKYFTFPLDKAGLGADNPFRKPQYLIINLALGGSWGGEIDDSIFPQEYLIDYVRVYKLKND
jgi:beta-glucanase (GH16 family)